MFGRIGKFFANRAGSFAVQFAIMVVPLTLCTGLAVDGGRVFLARYELAQSLDAAALAVGSTINKTQDQLKALAQTYVDANFRGQHHGPIDITLSDNASGNIVNLKGKVVIDTYFMPLIGKNTVDVTAQSTIRRGGNSVEVALALDVTGSMDETPSGDTKTKLTALKAAAKQLIDTVVADQQPPAVSFHSRIAIMPWALNLYPGSSATVAEALRGPITGTVKVPEATWRASSVDVSNITWRTGNAFTITKIAKVSGKVQVTVSANPSTFANGDTVAIFVTAPATNSYNYLNTNRYIIADKTSASPWTFNLKDTSGTYLTPPTGTLTNATAGTTQECLHSSCMVQVTTSANHGFSGGASNVVIMGLPAPYDGSVGTSLNNTADYTWTTVASTPAPTSTTFYINGSYGPTVTKATADPGTESGTVNTCFTTDCPIRIRLTNHGLVNGNFVRITGLSGEWGTDMNNNASLTGTNPLAGWEVEAVSGEYMRLKGTKARTVSFYTPNSADYQCLQDGCAIITYKTMKSGNPRVFRPITNCVSERKEGDLYGPTAPGPGQYLGRVYDGDPGQDPLCTVTEPASNPIMGFDDDKSQLKAKIDDLRTEGSTAGQIGIAWAEYMTSPNFRNIFPANEATFEYQPSASGTTNLARIVVFMSDGEFNSAWCNGTLSNNWASATTSTNRNSECGAGSSPFVQALEVCKKLRANNIRVFTIGFDVGTTGDAADFMKNCATREDMAFLPKNSTELDAAFSQIAASISRLRISQ